MFIKEKFLHFLTTIALILLVSCGGGSEDEVPSLLTPPDVTAPTISLITPPVDNTYLYNQNLLFSITFDEKVFVSGVPSVQVTIGASIFDLPFTTGDGSTTLNFNSNITIERQDLDGIDLNLINLNGGSIKDAAGNDAEITITPVNYPSIFVDSIRPVLTSVNFNASETYTTNASAFINSVVTNADEMIVSTAMDCSVGTFVSYDPALPYTLNSNSVNDVYIQFQTTSGNKTVCTNISIIHDDQLPNTPVISQTGDATTSQTDTATWVNVTDNGPSGLLRYEYAVSTTTDESGIIAGASWSDIGTVLTYQLTSGVTIATATNYYTLVKAIDNALNESNIAVSSAWQVLSNPVINSLDINSAALYTNDLNITINIDVFNANEMIVSTASDCSAGTWEAYATTKAYLLGTANALNTIYMQFRNISGGVSTCNSLSITHDDQLPDAPIISQTGDATTSRTDTATWAAVNDNGPAGVLRYEYAVSTTNDESGIISGAGWTAIGNILNYQITSGVSIVLSTDYYTLIKAVDNALNESTIAVSSSWQIISPSILSVTVPLNNTYIENDNLDFTVNFDRDVVVSGSPQISLDIGGTTRQAVYFAGTSSSTALTFRYTISLGDNDNNGISHSSPINLNSGTILDSVNGNAAILDFTPNNTSGVIVYTIDPAILVFNQTSTFDFGQVSLGESSDTTMIINYSGGENATTVNSINPSAPFGYKGGSFPGTGGTCSTTIANNCTIVLSYTPTTGTVDSGSVTINYNDGVATQSITRNLTGEGISLTPTKILAIGPTGIITNNCIPYTIKSTDNTNTAANVLSNENINLVINNGTGNFYSNATCTTTITSTSIASGTSSKLIYFRTTTGNQTLTLIFNATTLSNTSKEVTTASEPTIISNNAPSEINTDICTKIPIDLVDGNGIKSGSASSIQVNIAQTGSVELYSDSFCTGSISSLNYAAYESTKDLFVKNSTQETITLTLTDNASNLTQSTATINFVTALTWWNMNYDKRIRITLDNLDQAVSFSNIPVLIKLNNSRINYANTLTGGADIRFVLEDQTTLLDYEIDTWNPSGDSYIWVRIPSMAASTEMNIYLYFDDPSATDAQNPSGVWTNYSGAWHLNDSASTYYDSSPSSYDGTVMGTKINVSGVIGNALNFNGSSDLDVGTNLAPIIGQTSTLSFWIKTNQVGSNTNWQAPGITGVEEAGGGNDIFFGFIYGDGSIAINSGNSGVAKSNFVINDNTWRNITMSRNATTGIVKFYVNGVLNGSGTSETGYKSNAFQKFGVIGDTGGSPNYFNGSLDGIRLHTGIHPNEDARIKAEHKFGSEGKISYSTTELK